MSSSTFSLLGYIFNSIYNNKSIYIIAPSKFVNTNAKHFRYLKTKTNNIINIIKTNKKYKIINVKCMTQKIKKYI
jgi:hypothetical protein